MLEAEAFRYTIRLPANKVLRDSIAHLLKRPVGRPPNDVRRYHANFSYQTASWTKPRRVVAKVQGHPGDLYQRVGFTFTNLSRSPKRVVAFYNQRGTAEQHIKEGKNAIKWTRLRQSLAISLLIEACMPHKPRSRSPHGNSLCQFHE